MPIVSSVFVQDEHTQKDGSRFTIERHTDNMGSVYTIGPYAAPSNFDVNAVMLARASTISEQLAEQEAQGVLSAN